MLAEYGQLGVPALRLLAEGPTVPILRELADGPSRPSELKQRLPDVAHSALMRRLAELALKGAVAHKRVVGLPTRAYYSLTEAGGALLHIHEASERWERQWSPQERPDAPGRQALRLLADERTRAIMRAVADAPQRPIDLELLPGLGRPATRRRLGPLLRSGILTRLEEDGQVVLRPDRRRTRPTPPQHSILSSASRAVGRLLRGGLPAAVVAAWWQTVGGCPREGSSAIKPGERNTMRYIAILVVRWLHPNPSRASRSASTA